jgi:hypothetical protein
MCLLYLYYKYVVSFFQFQIEKKEDFVPACTCGDVKKVKSLIQKFSLDLNEGLNHAVKGGHYELIEFLIDQGATNINQNIKTACENNNYFITELLIQKGGKVEVGLRYSQSSNITKMLYRYKQKSEMIN